MKGFSYKIIPDISFSGEIYSAVGVLGNGGAGSVFKLQSKSGKTLALKVLKPDSSNDERKRFEHEYDFLHKNSRKGLAKALDWRELNLEVENKPYEKKIAHCPSYLMPLYECSFRKILKGQRSPTEKLHILLTIIPAISFVHKKGVVHRDLKPENFLYDKKNKKLYLADFGIAKYSNLALTTKGSRLHNNLYFAPEQSKNSDVEVGPYTDIYALGLMINECFTGVVPRGNHYRSIGSIDARYAFLDPIVESMTQSNIVARERDAVRVLNEINAREGDMSFLHGCIYEHLSRNSDGSARSKKILRQASLDVFTNCYMFLNPELWNNFNSDFHSNIHYRLRPECMPDLAVQLISQTCKAKLDYELGAGLSSYECAINRSYCPQKTFQEMMDLLKIYETKKTKKRFSEIVLRLSKLFDYHAAEVIRDSKRDLAKLEKLKDDCTLSYLLWKLKELFPECLDLYRLVGYFGQFFEIDFENSSSSVSLKAQHMLNQNSDLAIFLKAMDRFKTLYLNSSFNRKRLEGADEYRYFLYFAEAGDAADFRRRCAIYVSMFEPHDVKICDVQDMLNSTPFDGKEDQSYELDGHALKCLLPKILMLGENAPMKCIPDEALFLEGE